MFDTKQIIDKINVPPQLREPFAKIVVAGMKVMFSEQTGGLMMQQLKSSPDMVKNLSEGIAGLMAILYKQSKGMPPQLLVPAGLALLMHAIDFVQQTKIADLTPQQIGDATQATISAVMAKFGVQQQQASAVLQQMAQKGQSAQQPKGIIQGAA